MCGRFLKVYSMLAVTAALLLAVPAAVQAEDEAAKVTYTDHVQPILRQKCFACHNPDKKSGGLDVTNYTNLMQGGGSGAVIEPGSSGDSYLYMLVSHASEPFMPPMAEKLPDEMLATIAKWIDGGALEQAGSKPMVSKKPKVSLALQEDPAQRPSGPPPMPGRIGLEPVTRTSRAGAVTSLAASPWAPLIAVAGPKQVLLYHSQSLELLGVLPFPEGQPNVVRFSRNGALVLAGGGQGGASGKVVVWQVADGQRVIEAGDELDAVLAADIVSDQSLVALGGPQRKVRVYATADGSLAYELAKHTDWVYSVAFSPDGVLLATADRNGGVHVWEARTGREYLTLAGHSAAVTALSWRADSNVLATGSEDGTIRLWEMENGGQIKNWGAHGGVSSLEFTRSGELVSTGRDRVTRFWDGNGQQLREFEAFDDIGLRTTFCNESRRVVAGDWTGTIRVWEAADGKRLGELTSNPPRLAERLEAAKSQLAARQADAAAATAAEQAEQAAFAKATTDLETVRQQLAAARTAAETAAAGAAATQKQLAEATVAQSELAKRVQSLEKAGTLLQQSLAATQAAAGERADDKELAELAARVKIVADARSAELASARQRSIELASVTSQAEKQLAELQRQATEATAKAEALQPKVAPAEAVLREAEAKLAAARVAAEAARQAASEAEQLVTRWQQEIDSPPAPAQS